MKISYPVEVEKKRGEEYPVRRLAPLDNVLTYGMILSEALDNGREALTGVLESLLNHGMGIPDPSVVEGGGAEGVYWIEPAPKVAIPILIWKACIASGLTLEELSQNAEVDYQQVQRWERS
jgi:predicted RNase H-like HicB family nuclease